MLKCFPKIVIDGSAAPATKRPRLEARRTEGITTDGTCNIPQREPSEQMTATPSTCATTQAICEDTLVCYGMVRHNCLPSWCMLTVLRYLIYQ
jgi:hypothetical protein